MKFLTAFKRQPPRFTTNLEEIRTAKGVSVEDLAKDCQVTVQTILQITQRTYEPSVVLAEHLANRLEVRVEDLFAAIPPALPLTGEREERIKSQVHQLGYWLFLFAMFGSLAAANVLIQMEGFEKIGYIAGGAFFGLCLLFVGLSARIKGMSSFSRTVNTRRIPSKRKQIGMVTLQGVLFAALMTLWQHDSETLLHGLAHFVLLATLYAGFNYWLLYRKSSR